MINIGITFNDIEREIDNKVSLKDGVILADALELDYDPSKDVLSELIVVEAKEHGNDPIDLCSVLLEYSEELGISFNFNDV